MISPQTTRRNFLITSMMAAGGVMGSAACQPIPGTTIVQAQSDSSSAMADSTVQSSPVMPASLDIPQRILGRTEVQVPILGLGGAGRTPLSRPEEESEALVIIERALKYQLC